MVYTPIKPTEPELTSTSGNQPIAWQLLGAGGGNIAGPGKWVKVPGCQWKTFFLRAAENPFNAALGAGEVEIHGTNELNPTSDDTLTPYKLLGTLTAAAPSLEHEPPFRYIRASIKTPGSVAMQVDFHGVCI